MQIRLSSFEEIYPIWKEKLWVGRQSPIESHSAMKFLGGFNMEYFNNPSCFIIAKEEDKIIGCLSGHGTEPLWYRSRGLWVDENYRRNNIASLMMEKLFSEAVRTGYKWIWTVPRISSMPFYESVGFIRSSPDFDEGVEFGPNCYAARILC